MAKYVHAYSTRTGQKRRIPARWLLPNVFGSNWSETPSSRSRKGKGKPVKPTEPVSSEAGSPIAPANGDAPRKDQ